MELNKMRNFLEAVYMTTPLTQREEHILEERFFGEERGLEEVSKKFGITRERARQIEMAAINKLKEYERIQRNN